MSATSKEVVGLDVRSLMAVPHAESFVKGLSRRERFSRKTTISTFFYLYVYDFNSKATVEDAKERFKELSKVTYNNVPICTLSGDNQVEWNFEIQSIIRSIKNPLVPRFEALPAKLERPSVLKRGPGRPKKAKRGRPAGSKNITKANHDAMHSKLEALKSLKNTVEMKKNGMVFFFGLPQESLGDTELSRKVQDFMKTLG